jgi:hypothetical protein
MHYYQIQNPGIKGWITHEDNEIAHISEYPGNIWTTENTEWAQRVSAVEITKEEAQSIVNQIITQAQSEWTENSILQYPENIVIP